MNLQKRILALLISLLMLLTSALVFADEEDGAATAPTTPSSGGRVVEATALTDVVAQMQSTEGATIRELVKSDQLTVFIVNEATTPNFIVRDNRNGHEWLSWCPEGMLLGNMNKTWTQKVNSLFNVNYVKYSEKKSVATEIPGAEGAVVVKDTANGATLSYTFRDIAISFDVNVALDGDKLTFTIPADSIKEGEFNGLTSIEFLPNFGASTGDTDGYIFYPDGSGALLHNKNYTTVDKASKYTWQMYGEHNVDLAAYEKLDYSDRKTAMLPVYGIKQGQNALIGILTAGAADSLLNLYPSGYIMRLNRMSAEFVYRRFYNTPRQDGTTVLRSEKTIINQDHAIDYIFFVDGEAGDQTTYTADYNGMANAYRDYLLENGLLTNVLEQETEMPFALDLFLGIQEESMLFNKFVSMTTYDEAVEIYDGFANQGVANIWLNLEGWNKAGYGRFPDKADPNRKLGGKSSFTDLIGHVKGKNGKLFLQMNLTDAMKSNKGFSTRNDVLYTNSQMLITDAKSEQYILSPKASERLLTQEYAKKLQSYGISGLTFEKIGKHLYNDYNKKSPIDREGAMSVYQSMLDFSKQTFGSAANEGGNAYTFAHTDRLKNIPSNDSGFFISDECVPFYQMVVHGYLPYTDKAANLFHDSEKQLLEWIELGYTPYYELTYHEPSLMKNTAYNKLFTSLYSDWVEPASETYRAMQESLGDLWKQPMVRHEKLSDAVRRVQYADGTAIYVNYSDAAVTIDGVQIDAVDYTVVKGGGAL